MKKLGLLLAALPLAAIVSVCGQRTAASDEQAIRDLFQRYSAAVEARDVDAIMAFYVSDESLLAYDA